MKKIGIITYQETTNFGSTLQAYALWKAISKFGYDVEIINYECEKIRNKELHKYKLDSFKNFKRIILNLFYRKNFVKKCNNLSTFLKENAKLSDKRYYKNDINQTNKIYEHFMVGSDIVWNPNLTDEYTYFLDFVNDNKLKQAFASSVGNPYTNEQKKIIKNLINRFQNIAVRESESKEWIEELYTKKVDLVCDPTMLLTSEEWKEFACKRIISEKYVLVYFNDSESKCLNDAIEYGKKNNLNVYFINYLRAKKNCKTIRPMNISEFLSLILYSEHVFTASYHGLLFSIYFNKPFLYYNWAHKSRMESLSNKLKIENQNGLKINIEKYEPKLNWIELNKNVSNFRNDSLVILKNMLLENDKILNCHGKNEK